MFQILNKFEICSYLNFVQIRILFKIKICSNSKSKQISKFKIIQISGEKKEKRKNRQEASPGPAQQKSQTGGANFGAPAGGD
jgi:hypothetical protein